MINARASARRASRGFTLLELVVVLTILAILGGILMDRLGRYAEFAEKTSMEYTVNSINTALLMEYAELTMRNRRDDTFKLAQSNPVGALAQKPSNYLGEFTGPPAAADLGGNWYYDSSDHQLIYLVQRAENFQPDSTGAKRVRFKVMGYYDTTDPRVLVGLVLSPVEPYHWL
jgi:prepilin-type N-terminal cleavage/methylation domain-containing protein